MSHTAWEPGLIRAAYPVIGWKKSYAVYFLGEMGYFAHHISWWLIPLFKYNFQYAERD
jgi:hypothetical protein